MSGALVWEAPYQTDPQRDEEPVDVEVAPDGTAAFVLTRIEGTQSLAVVRFDALDGSSTLLALDDGPMGAGVAPVDLAIARSGDAVFVLSSFSGVTTLAAYDAFTGVNLWSNSLNLLSISELQVGPDSIHVAGFRLGADLTVQAFDLGDGSLVWENAVGGGTPGRTALSADGSLLVVGDGPYSVVGPPAPGGTLAFDAATGALLWSAPETPDWLAASDDGGQVFAVRTLTGGAGVETTALVDGTTGGQLWQQLFASGTNPIARDLATDSGQGSLAVALTTDSMVTGPVALVLDYDTATGSLMWLQFADIRNRVFLEHALGGTRVLASGSTPMPLPDGTTPQIGRQVAFETATGFESWNRSTLQETGTIDTALALAVSPDGTRTLVSGSSSSLGDAIALVALDSQTGAEQWSLVDAAAGLVEDQQLVVAHDGSVVFLSSRADDVHRVLAAKASDGSVLWSRTLPDSRRVLSATGSSGLGRTSDSSTIFVAYYRDTPALSADPGMAVLALDAATGATLWERFLDPGTASDTPHALAVAPDDASLVVVGRSAIPQVGRTLVAVALDAASGADLWTAFGPPKMSDHAADVALSADGTTVFVAANGYDEFDPRDHIVVAFDRLSGAELWDTGLVPEVGVRDLALSRDGSQVVVTGSSFYSVQGGFRRDVATIAYDAATGVEQWRSDHVAPQWEVGLSIGVGDDGNTAFVTGVGGLSTALTATGGSSFLTFAYDLESGAELWSANFGNSTNAGGGPVALAVGPDDGRLFVAGSDFDRDLSVFAYDIPELVTDAETLSLAAGGTTNLGLRPGLGSEGDFYFVVGSATGTSPGVDLGGGLVLPLVLDAYSLRTLPAKAPVFAGFQGSFDGKGLAAASLSIPAGADPALAGTTLHHAYVAADVLGFPDAVSNPVELRLDL